MKKIILSCIIGLSLITVLSTNVYGQSLYEDIHSGDLKKIKDSKYLASNISVVRNAEGELISVVKTDATRYLPKTVTDKFLDTLPVLKKGNVNGQNLSMMQITVEYNYDKCLTDMYQVPGYDEQCNWYHRPFVTSLAVNDENGDRFELFRGLNHSYSVKPSDSVTSHWTILRAD